MIHELIYTSARKGLKPGTRGYCTVAHSRSMSPAMVRLLESLSAYGGAAANLPLNGHTPPPAISHYRTQVQNRTYSILSRISPISGEQTSRDNKIAHHIVLDCNSRPATNPARLVEQTAFHTRWQAPPGLLDKVTALPIKPGSRETAVGPASIWERTTGDPGWAGVLAHYFMRFPLRPVYLLYQPKMEILKMMDEALALIPEEQQWFVTFNTYFNRLPTGVSCLWRCCLPDAPSIRERRLLKHALILDLAKLEKEPPASLPEVQMARGQLPKPSVLPQSSEPEPANKPEAVTAGDTVRIHNTPAKQGKQKP